MINKLVERLSNTKTRTLLLFVLFLLLLVVLGIVFFGGKETPLRTEQSKAASIPSITSVPGQVTTERYQELQIEANKRRALEAKKSGTSAVATIIGSTDKDGLTKKETFGIEDHFLKQGECKCPPQSTSPGGNIPELDPVLAQKLITEIAADPSKALQLFQQNPGLARALCNKNPELALRSLENNKEAAKIMLKECPSMAKLLAEKNPALFKELMLENPELAKSLAATYPDTFKKLMKEDPDFFKRAAAANPELVKTLVRNDPDFAADIGRQHPDTMKELLKGDPEFAKVISKNNPGLVKEWMLKDPEFAKLVSQNNPDVIKELMKGDPEFAAALAEDNPTLVKELMKNDPKFAAQIAELNPSMVKTLLSADPEFAKALAKNNPELMDTLMKNDPAFAKELLEKVPGINAILEANRKKGLEFSDKDRITAAEVERQRRLAEQAQSARQVQLSELQQKQLAALLGGMETQANNQLKVWTDPSTQIYVAGDWAKTSEEKKGGQTVSVTANGKESTLATAQGGNVLMKAGSICFAVLDTSVNTDEPGPILATIVDGPLKGGKLIGAIQPFPSTEGTRPEKVSLNFTTLSHPDFPSSLAIQGVAIDTDTARTAMATDVDHHYLLRYGATFGAAFMAGYAKVITSMGTTQTTAANGLATTITTPQLSGKKQIYASLGEVGKQAGEMIKPLANAPNTITVNAGTGFGLLILSDVSGS
jgi:hypothetical protein